MTPYLNEDYETMHTKKDIVLVNMWPFGGAGFSLPWREERKRRLERGMVVLFRYVVNTWIYACMPSSANRIVKC